MCRYIYIYIIASFNSLFVNPFTLSQIQQRIGVMKWSSLHLNALPIIAVETQQAVKNIQCTYDHQAELSERVSRYGRNEDIDELNKLRTAIENRIKMIDQFYQRKYKDQNISLFHMLGLKLKRAIFKMKEISDQTIEVSLGQDHGFSAIFQNRESQDRSDLLPVGNNGNSKKQTAMKLELSQLSAIKSKKTSPNHSRKSLPRQLSRKSNHSPIQSKIKQEEQEYEPLFKDSAIRTPKDNKLNKHLKPGSKANQTMVNLHKKTNSTNRSSAQLKTAAGVKTISYQNYVDSYKKVGSTKKGNSFKRGQKIGVGSHHKEILISQEENRRSSRAEDSQTLLIEDEPDGGDGRVLENSEFKFTIKMSREEYKSLLNMKKEMILSQSRGSMLDHDQGDYRQEKGLQQKKKTKPDMAKKG